MNALGRIFIRKCPACFREAFVWDRVWTWWENQYTDGTRYRKRICRNCADSRNAARAEREERDARLRRGVADYRAYLQTADGAVDRLTRLESSPPSSAGAFEEYELAIQTALDLRIGPSAVPVAALIPAYAIAETEARFNRNAGFRASWRSLADKLTILLQNLIARAEPHDLSQAYERIGKELDRYAELNADSGYDFARRDAWRASLDLLNRASSQG